MLSQQVISVTELRTNTKKILNSRGVKYIFTNNKPQNVIMDIKSFEQIQKKLKQQDIIDETMHAEKNGIRFSDVDTLMADLLA